MGILNRRPSKPAVTVSERTINFIAIRPASAMGRQRKEITPRETETGRNGRMFLIARTTDYARVVGDNFNKGEKISSWLLTSWQPVAIRLLKSASLRSWIFSQRCGSASGRSARERL